MHIHMTWLSSVKYRNLGGQATWGTKEQLCDESETICTLVYYILEK